MNYKVSNAYYFYNLNKIGGIESHLYYLMRKYGMYDICVFYRTGSYDQANRIRKYGRCIKLEPNDIVECTNLFCCFNTDILNHCAAKKKYLVLHGDYKAMVEQEQLSRHVLPIDERIDKYLGVSQLVCDSWKKLTGINAEYVGEPVILDEVDEPLMLCSATRLTKEKGWERMQALAKALNKNHVNFMWFIFTDKESNDLVENMYFMKPRLDIVDKLQGFDAYIQLSSNEGFNLSVVEALKKNVPVIVTKLPVYQELGLNEDNSIQLDLDMKNIPIDKIKSIKELSFKYKEPKDNWLKYIAQNKRQISLYQVKATKQWKVKNIYDVVLGKIPEEADTFVIDEDRYTMIKQYEKKNGVQLIELLDHLNADTL